jgi:hypothetical protein
MRTTVSLDPDIEAEVERLRRSGVGVSEAINQLARRGLASTAKRAPYVHHSRDLGGRMDVTNIGDVLDLLDGSDLLDGPGGPGR